MSDSSGSSASSESSGLGSGAAEKSLKHELRTPLNHIIGYCEMLLEETEDQGLEVFSGDLQRIHSAGRRLLAVINDLVDPGKSSTDRLDESLVQHEVRTPLNQIIGYAEMLQEEAADLGQGRFIPDFQKIHIAARTLLSLVVERLLPLQREGVEAAVDAGATTFHRRGELSGPARLAEAAGPDPVPKGKLLVVDDNELNRDMLARRLERLGYEVVQAENGMEALARLEAGSYDLVLLDILMPVLNGYQVLQRLAADPAYLGLPVIVLSASDDTASVARCVGMGAADYLTKPFDPVLLQARISACLEKKRLRDQEVSYLRQIQAEKERSDQLLRVILPHDVAEELKATQAVQPRRFEDVGVLFADVAGFTAYCDGRSPEEIMGHLQRLVESFEALSTRHGLEKIKTIGDAFMATAGLLAPVENPALSCVRCGLDMINAARQTPPHWNVRVGVHVGPVTAGVVGKRKYQYDVWGDAVNTASRMEEAAEPGAVCVNGETWVRLAGLCRGRSQGTVQIKGKGELELFRVEAVGG